MADKKEAVLSDSNARLQIWLSFAKFVFAVFFICGTLIRMNHEKVKSKIEIAELENGCGGDDQADEAKDKK